MIIHYNIVASHNSKIPTLIKADFDSGPEIPLYKTGVKATF